MHIALPGTARRSLVAVASGALLLTALAPLPSATAATASATTSSP